MTIAGSVFSDVDDCVRQWVRDAVPSVNRRAFFAPNNAAPFPQIRVWRLPSVDESALFQFDVWGDSLQGAQDVAVELANAAENLGRYEHDGTRLHGAVVERKAPMPDPDSDRPRVVVDVIFAAYAA